MCTRRPGRFTKTLKVTNLLSDAVNLVVQPWICPCCSPPAGSALLSHILAPLCACPKWKSQLPPQPAARTRHVKAVRPHGQQPRSKPPTLQCHKMGGSGRYNIVRQIVCTVAFYFSYAVLVYSERKNIGNIRRPSCLTTDKHLQPGCN